MAQFYSELNENLRAFMREQKIFFTASAPEVGRINLSPKGMDSFRCLSDRRVAYLNLTGSGNETAAHLAENGRLTIMFCGFEKRPLILRLYGTGRAVHHRDAEWAELYALFPDEPGARQIIVMEIESVQTSCGFAVPFFDYQGERETLRKHAESLGTDGIQNYWEKHNTISIDGLPTKLFLE
ncbi:MAG: pyridoxamine 5'-phosphate oxidase family protein [Ardenticatenaceae bacterium]|nr:pyridoxamine 5'-phosphate oxidase family protein [Ardenticatenaceae bacterium]